MSAIVLYDILAKDAKASSIGADELSHFGADLIQASLADWQRLIDYEQRFALREDADEETWAVWDRSIWQLHQEWAVDAAVLISRLAVTQAATLPAFSELQDAHARTRARLSVKPEQLRRARADAQAGRTIPIQVLRDELHTRRHA